MTFLEENKDRVRRRIHEIKDAKNISGNAIARHLHLSPSALHQTLKPGSSTELRSEIVDQIASLFRMSTERLLQKDVEDILNTLQCYYVKRTRPEEYLDLALEFHEIAIKGTSEESEALIHIGHAYTLMGDSPNALSNYTRAYEILTSIEASEEMVKIAALNFCEGWLNVGNFDRLLLELDNVQSYINERHVVDFYVLGKLKHYAGIAYFQKNNPESSRQCFQDALSYYRIANRLDLVSRTLHDLSHLALIENDITGAIELIELSRELLCEEDELMQAISDKDYSKLLVLNDQLEKAGLIVRNRLSKVKDLGTRPDIEAKLILLSAICTGEDEQLESLFFQTCIRKELKIHAAFLIAQKNISCYLAEQYLDILKEETANLLKMEWF